ncbi:MAG: T9SS type A sorting domain-containing protein [Ignavibacteriales bacterium]|nr:MAG: T9SS type A sorting domain-containing protein [Ignavibacteriales bacterium]
MVKSIFRHFGFVLIVMLFAYNFSYSQKPVQNRSLIINPDVQENSIVRNNIRYDVNSGIPVALYKPDYAVTPALPRQMAEQYLFENAQILKIKSDLSDLRYVTTTETRAGYHIHFAQYIGDYPVYNSTINVTINSNNQVIFVMNGYKVSYDTKESPDLSTLNISAQDALASAKQYLGVSSSIELEKSQTVVYFNKGQFTLAQLVNIVPKEGVYGDWEVMVNAQSGEIFRVVDKSCYHKDGPDNPNLVNGTGYVFDPDPITHARTSYGTAGFVDNNDLDSDSLTAHREFRVLNDITFEGGVYSLKGPYAEIVDFESPFTGLHTSATSEFHYTRSSDNFEAVNVYFLIDASMRWINDSLGITLHPFQYTGGVRVDPHGLSGDDNSHYIPSTGQLAFGDGGVDDAEDVGVVLHELGHGIHDWLTAGSLSQVQGLSEGCGDYWTTSYIRGKGILTPSHPAYFWVFVWDGHNPFWAGRIVNYTAHYPQGLTGTIHTDGQMWASSLMSIWDLIGKEATDTDFLEALAMTNSSSNQQDAANAFIAADQTVYSGSHLAQIIPVFADRGYIEGPITPDFTANITSGNAPLTVQFTDLSIGQPNPITSWQWDFNNDGVVDATVEDPQWTYTNFGVFTVKLTVSDGTNFATKTKVDYINVTDPNQVTDTLFSDKFESGTGAWTITNNGGACVWEIFTPPYPNTYTLPAASSGGVFSAESDDCGSNTTMNTTSMITQTFNCSNYPLVVIHFDNDWRILDAQDEAHLEISTDGGTTWTGVWDQVGVDVRNTHESINISQLAAGQSNVKIRLRSVQPGWDWWWTVDNFAVLGTYVTPVELTSFSASANDDVVMLSWSTATETNNNGFEVERKSIDNEFQKVGFVEGYGTTTQAKLYSFVDSKVPAGRYSYRLKQIDFDGTYEYSPEVEVKVKVPYVYSLEQNYPNPFNPTTKISYSIPEEGFVTLAIYNLLGEKVATLINETQKAGRYDVKFQPENLSSGMYVYRLETKNFTASKKFVLMK